MRLIKFAGASGKIRFMDYTSFNMYILSNFTAPWGKIGRTYPATVWQEIYPSVFQLLTYKATPGNEVAMIVIKNGQTWFFPEHPPYSFFQFLSDEALEYLSNNKSKIPVLIECVKQAPYPEAMEAIFSQPGIAWLKLLLE